MKPAATALAVSLLAALSFCVLGADSPAQLPGFYPEPKQVGAYDPAQFIPARDARAKLPQGYAAEKDFVETKSLDGEWKFSGLESSKEPFPQSADLDKSFAEPAFNAASWAAFPVPLNWYKRFPDAASKEKPYVKGWYRRSIEIPASAAGKRTVVRFGVVGYEALLFVNGREAGGHHGDFTPWEADISQFVTPGKPAVIALRVFSDVGPKFGAKPEALHTYGAQWSKGTIKGGIWQHCELRFVPELRVAEVQVSPDLDSGSVKVDCVLRNDSASSRKVELLAGASLADASKTNEPSACAQVGSMALEKGDTKYSFTLKLERPALWSPESPKLYNLSLPLMANGKPLSVKTVRFGFRSFKSLGSSFALNGRPIYLFGENVPALRYGGNGETSEELKAKAVNELLKFKSLGYNIVRNPHMPIVEEFLEAADEVGMMLYDEWSWCFTDKIVPGKFDESNLAELAEWVRRDYNHACVVMWCGGNEVKCNPTLVESLDRQVQLIRSLERSGRPVSSFSGSASHEFGGGFKLDTDALDLHSYIGLGPRPWSYWERDFNSEYNNTSKHYPLNAAKRFEIPYMIWELVGFSWGAKYDKYKPGDVKSYLRWAKGNTRWEAPNGIGWAGAIGLDAALDPKRGGSYGMESVGRRIFEYIRQDSRVCHFAPWFQNPDLLHATLWTQPVYCGLRAEHGLPPLNLFAGQKLRASAFVVNSASETCKDATLRISLADSDGSEKTLQEWKPGEIKPLQKASSDIEIPIPDAKAGHWAQLRLRTLVNGKELSRNFYNVFIQSLDVATAPLPVSGVGVLSCKASGEKRLNMILDALKVKRETIADPAALKSCRLLIVPPSSKQPEIDARTLQAIQEWVKEGRTLLTLEQSWAGELPLLSKKIVQTPTVFADLVVPAHPAFKGLAQASFEFWSNPDFGQTGGYGLSPLDESLVAAKAPPCSKPDTYAILTDAKSGKGRIIASQFDACDLWGSDSAATSYLRNLLADAATAHPSAPAK